MLDDVTFGRLLTRVEGDMHRGGWDQPAQALILVDAAAAPDTAATFRRIMHGSGAGIRVGDYLAQPWMSQRLFTDAGGSPVEVLDLMAHNLAFADAGNPSVDMMRSVARAPGVVGFAFVCESWMRKYDSAEEAARRDSRRNADIPGSKEIRMALAATIDGRQWVVQRVRGQNPQQDRGPDKILGFVPRALRMLCDVAQEQVPPMQEYAQRYGHLMEDVVQS